MPNHAPATAQERPVESTAKRLLFASNLHPDTPPAQPTRLILACHAENMQSRLSHLTPDETGLSAKGWEQTIALAHWLHAYEDVDGLLTDNTLRARLTAQRIGQQINLRLRSVHDLPRGADPGWDKAPPLALPDGESLEAVARYEAYSHELALALSHLLAERWGQTTLLVTNAVAIASLLRSFAGNSKLGIAVSHASLSEAVYRDGRWSLAYINRTEHLTRRARNRRTPPTESPQNRSADQELLGEIDRLAHFYNQVAARLGPVGVEPPSEQRRPLRELNSEQIREFGELDEESHLLLAGVGAGELALELAQAGITEVVGVDISPAMLERAEFRRLSIQDERLQSVNFRLAPAHDLPFLDNRFDVVLCVNLLHHMAKPLPALREFHRVLAAHGKLLLIDIEGSPDAVKRATQNAIESKRNPTHATIRTGKQLAALLQESGFQVEKEQNWKFERNPAEWMGSIGVDEATQAAVVEMLEASIETDAAGLHVRRQEKQLRFDVNLVAFLARKAGG